MGSNVEDIFGFGVKTYPYIFLYQFLFYRPGSYLLWGRGHGLEHWWQITGFFSIPTYLLVHRIFYLVQNKKNWIVGYIRGGVFGGVVYLIGVVELFVDVAFSDPKSKIILMEAPYWWLDITSSPDFDGSNKAFTSCALNVGTNHSIRAPFVESVTMVISISISGSPWHAVSCDDIASSTSFHVSVALFQK